MSADVERAFEREARRAQWAVFGEPNLVVEVGGAEQWQPAAFRPRGHRLTEYEQRPERDGNSARFFQRGDSAADGGPGVDDIVYHSDACAREGMEEGCRQPIRDAWGRWGG